MGRTIRGEGKRRNKYKRCPVHKHNLVGKATKWGLGSIWKIQKRNQKAAPRSRLTGAIDYVRGHFGP